MNRPNFVLYHLIQESFLSISVCTRSVHYNYLLSFIDILTHTYVFTSDCCIVSNTHTTEMIIRPHSNFSRTSCSMTVCCIRRRRVIIIAIKVKTYFAVVILQQVWMAEVKTIINNNDFDTLSSEWMNNNLIYKDVCAFRCKRPIAI